MERYISASSTIRAGTESLECSASVSALHWELRLSSNLKIVVRTGSLLHICLKFLLTHFAELEWMYGLASGTFRRQWMRGFPILSWLCSIDAVSIKSVNYMKNNSWYKKRSCITFRKRMPDLLGNSKCHLKFLITIYRILADTDSHFQSKHIHSTPRRYQFQDIFILDIQPSASLSPKNSSVTVVKPKTYFATTPNWTVHSPSLCW